MGRVDTSVARSLFVAGETDHEACMGVTRVGVFVVEDAGRGHIDKNPY